MREEQQEHCFCTNHIASPFGNKEQAASPAMLDVTPWKQRNSSYMMEKSVTEQHVFTTTKTSAMESYLYRVLPHADTFPSININADATLHQINQLCLGREKTPHHVR